MNSSHPEQFRYCGRFAPSPSGELHFGSLVAAVGSYLQARSQRGLWLVRIEDIDPPREVSGSAESILHDLARLGMESDQPVLWQSQRSQAYKQALQLLLNAGKAFWCGCSRKDIPDNGVYPGTCRQGIPAGRQARCIRVSTEFSSPITMSDRLQPPFSQCLQTQVGDFVVLRADGLFAYQLAVVVDDGFQQVTEVVRGADLLDSTPRQIFLQQQLGLPTPQYIHLPLALNQEGNKLSKQSKANPVDTAQPLAILSQALAFLGHPPPSGITTLDNLWLWAREHWTLERVPSHSRHWQPA